MTVEEGPWEVTYSHGVVGRWWTHRYDAGVVTWCAEIQDPHGTGHIGRFIGVLGLTSFSSPTFPDVARTVTRALKKLSQQVGHPLSTRIATVDEIGLAREWQGLGIGAAIYVDFAALAAKENAAAGPAMVFHGNTSRKAQRAWRTVARGLPSVPVRQGRMPVLVFGNAEYAPGGP